MSQNPVTVSSYSKFHYRKTLFENVVLEMISGQMTFPRNYSLFRNKNKAKAIGFNPKCIFPYKRGPHTHCVYSTECVRLLYHVSIQVYLVTAKTRG